MLFSETQLQTVISITADIYYFGVRCDFTVKPAKKTWLENLK